MFVKIKVSWDWNGEKESETIGVLVDYKGMFKKKSKRKVVEEAIKLAFKKETVG